MTPADFLRRVIAPGSMLLPGKFDSRPARALLLAIAGQETGWAVRHQIAGPAVSYYQFEAAGVFAVLNDAETTPLAEAACVACDIQPTVAAVIRAIEFHDALATVFARLTLWLDPAPLPELTDGADPAWQYYLRCWRPGKPDQSRWGACHSQACALA